MAQRRRCQQCQLFNVPVDEGNYSHYSVLDIGQFQTERNGHFLLFDKKTV